VEVKVMLLWLKVFTFKIVKFVLSYVQILLPRDQDNAPLDPDASPGPGPPLVRQAGGRPLGGRACR
jgi:hypothetical protein